MLQLHRQYKYLKGIMKRVFLFTLPLCYLIYLLQTIVHLTYEVVWKSSIS